MSRLPLAELASVASEAAREAAGLIADWSGRNVTAEYKPGGDSPASQVVTKVDRLSQACILRHLQPVQQQYDLGLLTEEQDDDGSRREKEAFWCIDPLDGTQPFLEGTPGCAVSIALVARDGNPLIGVVCDPATGQLVRAWRGGGVGTSGFTEPRSESSSTLNLFADRSLADQPHYEVTINQLERIARELGCDGLEVDLSAGAVINGLRVMAHPPACYFKLPRRRLGGGSLWDYAAIACIFQESGLVACDMTGQALDLNRPDSTFLNHRGILFATDQSLTDQLLQLHAG